MNELSGAEAFVHMLRLHGVTHVFGLCGDTSLPLYDALHRLDHGIKHVLTRDERSAGYMADAYARVTGKVGICEGPSGGGATYILPGLVEANESSVPILAVTTDVSVSSRGRFALTELDQKSLFRPLTKWNAVLDRSVDVPRTLRAAFTHMTTGKPGSAHIGLPYDVQTGPVDSASVWADEALGRYPSRRVAPDPAAVEEAVRLIRAARTPVVICGGGVVLSGAEAELTRLAEAAGLAVATTISGQGSLSDQHPLSVGVVGSNGGTPQTREIVAAADLVIFVGCRAGSVTTERWRFPDPAKVKVVHIDIDPTVIGTNYRADVALVGDARLALAALATALETTPATSRIEPATLVRLKAEKFTAFEKFARSDERPIRPERFVAELQRVAPEDAVVVADPGTPCPYLSAYFQSSRTGRSFITNRAHGALGYSLSAAIGAQFGRPDKKCIAVMGDGSFGFTVGELETVVRHKLPITFIVLSNSVYGWIKAGQKTGFDRRYFSVDFDRTDHAAVAAAYGVKSFRVDDPEKLRATLAQAIAHDGPTLVDVISQPLHEANAPVSEWVA
ncbi:thiamine pyrophosphate-binding protein [Reyranella sp. CPCC 100927]|uniref:thiamine pyrophosphate-binding protein n=1 Tax=Reyranella sp. CPCC 100927 TaxID=2599616 RepID=UPI0011B5FE90|nr:thiamine pyrophosphate-binding protein [Reyranella sp. CPCC 100927]TWT10563.1 thiamine pyrophosphate-binding protein [Reyranella sp. CPCC 100927]